MYLSGHLYDAIRTRLARYSPGRDAQDWNLICAVELAADPKEAEYQRKWGYPAAEDVEPRDVAGALQLLQKHREGVDMKELALLDALTTAGWTWEQIARACGKDTGRAMQQYRRRLKERIDNRPHGSLPDIETI